MDRTLLSHAYPGVQFDELKGADGRFGPDGAIWHVHSHFYRGGLSSDAIVRRLGESISYTLAVTFGAAEAAEHTTTVVRALRMFEGRAPVVALKRVRAAVLLRALQEAGGTPRPKRQALARLAATPTRQVASA